MTDGGLIDIAPLGAAIDAGADEIMVLLTRNPKNVPYKSRNEMGNTIAVGLRDIDIMEQTVLEDDLRICRIYNDLIDAGHEIEGKKKVEVTVLYPKEPLGDSLDFSSALMQKQMAQGYSDAKELLSGPCP
jgi:predicted patatin/cPLA2 family phospholipase